MNKMFGDWINEEIDKRSWSARELARRSGLSSTTVIQVINGQVNPGLAFCKGVARAFGMPAENVLKRAGLIPPTPPETASVAECVYLFSQLSDEDQERVLLYMRAVTDRQPAKATT